MLRFAKSNLLEQHAYNYSLQDVSTPNLYRDLYPYTEVPKTAFNHRHVPLNVPEELWITDTTFRDGQQSRAPYTTEQMVDIYKLLHRLGGDKGIIRQTEFFVYSKKDYDAVLKCMELGYQFPEVTTWIRASKEDYKLLKNLGIKETGILVSCSDYHIFQKLKMTRAECMEHYLSVLKDALSAGIIPRCHFEDITRADFYGFVVPFAGELMRLSRESGIPVKIRACDTLGLGLPYPGVALPRSVPGIVYGLRHYAEVPAEWLEWHGHNDFYKGVANAGSAWLYGAAGVNCSLLGIGERTGNVPLEAMIFEYISLRGTTDGIDTTVITEIADYYRNVLHYDIPHMTPFVGKSFNLTRAGIHADGLLKDEEIYNIFDTKKILNRPVAVAVSNTSGLAGIALWLKENMNITAGKNDDIVRYIKGWVDAQYDGGRISSISDEELSDLVDAYRQEE
ncbi:Isopropylmalate/homocitrate/citramalate synthases [Sporobacter termitidis DSM 10068]|uniref:Isopropylmalate/homocitrate/citramalate synthases n=1 Tax=Sporobacter termitidis DSM 10068 TaxID=1123282 RepID=A0A1M5ZGK7_9FIRM|nr:2-isopropylmalate synthase [Sporobacter termitidis]SHI23271.1 Isopropylmalate/homocitrate/citramalate synthases [Sporobacter termitidis DSM 10068]